MAGSRLENTQQAVEGAEAGCADAALAVQAARSTAEDQTTWAEQMGITAHHSVLRQVVDALGEAFRQCETAHSEAGAAKNALRQLNEQFGRDDLVAKSGEAAEQMAKVSIAIQAATGKIDDDALTNANLSQDDYVIQAVHTASSAASEAFAKVETAAKAVETYQQQLRQSPGKWEYPPGLRRHDSARKNDTFNENYERWVRKSNGGPDDGREYLVEANGEKVYFDAVRTEFKDGKTVEVLIDAKGRYDQFIDSTGQFQEWWKDSKKGGLREAMKQARRQVAAADGRPVEWWCAEPKSAAAFNRAMQLDRALRGRVRAVYKPMPEHEQ